MNEDQNTRYQPPTTYYQQLDEQPLEQLEAQVNADWQVGDVILDLYEITALLGEGGMGKVYRAHHRGWNLDLAVKCPKTEVFASHQGKEDYIREAETWIELGLHPHICSCYYVRTLGDVPRLFAECVEGGSLESWIENGKLYAGGKEKALERILDIAIQFAWGLGYAHEQGLVHQDVKPHNVLMTPEGVAKVTDFGLAKARAAAGEGAVAGASSLVSAGGYTPAYCSPEQAEGRALDHRTDIWSWAVSVLEMFTGGVTWQLSGQYAAAILEEYLESGIVESDAPGMPNVLADLLHRCFADDPVKRPRDMNEIAYALQDLYQQVVVQAYSRQQPKAVELRADSLNNKALSLLDLGKNEQVEGLLNEALKVDPIHPEATYQLALLKWRQGAIDDLKVVQSVEGLLNAIPNRWPSAYLLALVHMERADLDFALASLGGLEEHMETKNAISQIQRMAPGAGLIKTVETQEQFIDSIAFSPDARYALIGYGQSYEDDYYYTGSYDHTLRLYDVETGTFLQTLRGHEKRVCSSALSLDRHFALSGSWDNTMRFWAVETGTCLHIFKGHQDGVTSVAFSPDSRLVLSGSADDTLRLWDSQTGICLRIFEGHKDVVNTVVFSPNGYFGLSGSRDRILRLWNLESGDCLCNYEGHTGEVECVNFSPDGRYALSGSSDMTLRLWDVETGACLRTYEGHSGSVCSVAFSLDGCHALSSGYDNTLRLWDVKTGACLRTLQSDIHVRCAAFRLDYQYALSGNLQGALQFWKLGGVREFHAPFFLAKPMSGLYASSQEQVFQEYLDHAMQAFQRRDFASTLHLIRQVRSIFVYERADSALEIWSALYQHCRIRNIRGGWNTKIYKGHKAGVSCAIFSLDGHYVLSGSDDTTLRLWDVETGTCLRIFEGHKNHVTSVAFIPDGRHVLSGSADNTIRLWDVETGTCLRVFEEQKKQVLSIAATPDGRYALSGLYHVTGYDHGLLLWEIETGTCLPIFAKGRESEVRSVAFSPDGQYALSSSHLWTLNLWKVNSGDCLKTFDGHTGSEGGEVNSVAYSPDGRFALSGSDDKTMRLWDISTGACMRKFEGHTASVTSVAFSLDGRFILSGSWDYTVRLWDLGSGTCLCNFMGHKSGITCVAFSPDRRYVVSGSADHTLRLWALDWELEDYQPVDWDEGARSYLQTFHTLHTPYVSRLPQEHQPTDEEVRLALTRCGKPTWSEDDFQQLLYTLGCAGYGWLRPDGVRRKLEEMAKER